MEGKEEEFVTVSKTLWDELMFSRKNDTAVIEALRANLQLLRQKNFTLDSQLASAQAQLKENIVYKDSINQLRQNLSDTSKSLGATNDQLRDRINQIQKLNTEIIRYQQASRSQYEEIKKLKAQLELREKVSKFPEFFRLAALAEEADEIRKAEEAERESDPFSDDYNSVEPYTVGIDYSNGGNTPVLVGYLTEKWKVENDIKSKTVIRNDFVFERPSRRKVIW